MNPSEAAALAIGWLLPALAVTVTVEVAAAALLGPRTWRDLAVVALANLATNPAVNLVVALAMAVMHARTLGHPGVLAVLAALETLVVIAEWRVYRHVLHIPEPRALRLSVLANAASLLAGLVVFGTGV